MGHGKHKKLGFEHFFTNYPIQSHFLGGRKKKGNRPLVGHGGPRRGHGWPRRIFLWVFSTRIVQFDA